MSREVRRVPPNWRHPKDANGNYIPLRGDSYSKDLAAWEAEEAKWGEGLIDDGHGGWEPGGKTIESMTFEEWYGPKPNPKDYMPDWPESERTHLQMYESTTEGTPISPVMYEPEQLAQWLYENRASVWASETTSYWGWLGIIQAGLEAAEQKRVTIKRNP